MTNKKSKTMKKYSVRVYLHTFCDFEVEAENEQEAIEIAESSEYDMGQIFENMIQDNSSDVEEIPNVAEMIECLVSSGWEREELLGMTEGKIVTAFYDNEKEKELENYK